MARTKSRFAVAFMALLVLTTGIVAAGQIPTFSPSSPAVDAAGPNTAVIAEAGQADTGLAVLSILLGGGMFYLFRPIRRIPVEIRS